jgi:hypothetical protein
MMSLCREFYFLPVMKQKATSSSTTEKRALLKAITIERTTIVHVPDDNFFLVLARMIDRVIKLDKR